MKAGRKQPGVIEGRWNYQARTGVALLKTGFGAYFH
jgi:hypothetical protein